MATKTATKPSNFATAPNLLEEAAGSAVAEKSERKAGIAALLTRQMHETQNDYPTLRHLPAYVIADAVHAVIAAGARLGWQVWKVHPMCSACRKAEAVKQVGRKVLADRQLLYLLRKWNETIETFDQGAGI